MADNHHGMRVLMTAETVGGVWTNAVELVRQLDARGVRVALATMGAPLTRIHRHQLAGLRSLTLHESIYKLEWMNGAWPDVERAGDWLLALDRQFKPDWVHLNQFAFGALPFTAPKLVVAHACVFSWWRAVHGKAPPASWDHYREKVTQGLDGANLVAATTPSMLQSLAHNYGYAQAGLVIANGRNPALFRAGTKQAFVMAAGRLWDEAKNIAALQAVAPRLPWPVRVAGSTEHPDGRLVPLAGVECLGELPPGALARQLAKAAVYALPARYEPFGYSVLEAALSGCALVLGDIDSLRQVWGPAAVYVAPDDHDALYRALSRLIDEPAERIRLGASARARALQFTPEQLADSYLSAYSLLHTAPAAGEVMQCA